MFRPLEVNYDYEDSRRSHIAKNKRAETPVRYRELRFAGRAGMDRIGSPPGTSGRARSGLKHLYIKDASSIIRRFLRTAVSVAITARAASTPSQRFNRQSRHRGGCIKLGWD